MQFKKLSYRIVFTYIVVLIVFFVLITSIIRTVFTKYMEEEAISKLNNEAAEICRLLEDKNLNRSDLFELLSQREKLNFAGQFITAQVMVVNLYNEMIYSDIVDPVYVKIFRDTNEIYLSNTNYYHVLKPIFNEDSISGYVVLLIKKGSTEDIDKIIERSLRISFFIAAIITLFLSAFLERSITGPIALLNEKISGFNIESSIDLPPIQTGDEIENLDESFMKMAKRIKTYDAKQKEFFQNTSHELKTPLMSIQGYAEAIKDGILEDEELEEGLDIIISESQRVKRTVDSIIYLTKLENVVFNFDFQKENLVEIVEHAINSVKSLAKERDIKINIHSGEVLMGSFDPEKLQRAFINLFSNGIRHANSKLDIHIRELDGRINVLVVDDGEGFLPDEEKRVFDRFYKGAKGNTGLGLSIVKAIVSGHEGVILAYNSINHGAVFDMRLPKK